MSENTEQRGGAGPVRLVDAPLVNVASGHGAWAEGRALLAGLEATWTRDRGRRTRGTDGAAHAGPPA